MPMIRLLVFLSLCSAFLPTLSFASTQSPFTVKSLTYLGSMPYVEASSTAAPETARAALRINHALYLDLLDLPAPARRRDGLKVKQSESPLAPVSEISFVVDRSDARLLALSISAEGCGAYCEGFTRSFVFDAGTGRVVVARDLFTSAGADAIAVQLARQRGTRIKAEIARLRAAANAMSKSGKARNADERESSREAADMFEACLPLYAGPARGDEALAIDELRLKGSAVAFVRGRCSNHVMQALDSLGEFADTLALPALTPHLNAYGKYLLGMGPTLPAPASPFGQVLFGKVGTAGITMKLRKPYGPDQKIGGVYFFDRFRAPISLFGPRRGEAWELTEEAEEGKPMSVLRFTASGENIKGEWVGSGKRLPFEAGP